MATSDGVSTTTRPTFRDLSYCTIRDLILDGSFPPGTTLRLDDLSESLGFSRTPVRDAIQLLAAESLVVTAGRSSARVTSPTAEASLGAVRTLEVLTREAIVETVPLLSIDQSSLLGAHARQAASRASAGDVSGMISAVRDGTMLLIEHCPNRVLAHIFARSMPLLQHHLRPLIEHIDLNLLEIVNLTAAVGFETRSPRRALKALNSFTTAVTLSHHGSSLQPA